VILLITHVVQSVCQALVNVKCASMVETINRVYANPKIEQFVGRVRDIKGGGVRGNVGI
jgi:hypothetical protein